MKIKERIRLMIPNRQKESPPIPKQKKQGKPVENFRYTIYPSVEKKISKANFEGDRTCSSVQKLLHDSELPDLEEKKAPPYENQLHSIYQAPVDHLKLVTGSEIAKGFNGFYHANDNLRLLFDDPDRYHEKMKTRLEEQFQKEKENHAELFKKRTEKHEADEKKLKAEEEKIEKSLTETGELLNLKSGTEKVRTVHPSYHFWIIMIAVADAIAIASALSVMREPLHFTASVTIGIIAALTASSHFGGILLKTYHRDRKRSKLLIAFAISTLALSIALFLGFARLFYLETETGTEFPDLIAFGFLAVNAFFYAISLFVSYMLHAKAPEMIEKYNRLQKAKKLNLKKQKTEMKNQEKTKKEYIQGGAALDEKHNQKLAELDERENQWREMAMEESDRINRVKNSYQAYAGIINQNYLERVHKVRNGVYFTGKKAEYLNLPPKELDTVLSTEELVYPFKNGFPVDAPQHTDYEDKTNVGTPLHKRAKPTIETENHLNGNGLDTQSGNSQKFNFIYPVIVFMAMFMFASCSTEEQPKTSIVCVADNTPNAVSETFPLQTDEVIKLLELEGEQPLNAAYFGITSVNDVSRNAFYEAELEAGSIVENKFTRREKVEKFRKKVDCLIEDAFGHKKDYERTRFHAVLSDAAHILKNQSGDRKILLVVSDMIENSQTTSFYELFKTMPPDYGQLMKRMEGENSLPQLDGVQVIILFHTDQQNIDQIARKVQSFWRFYLEKKGARVSFRAKL